MSPAPCRFRPSPGRRTRSELVSSVAELQRAAAADLLLGHRAWRRDSRCSRRSSSSVAPLAVDVDQAHPGRAAGRRRWRCRRRRGRCRCRRRRPDSALASSARVWSALATPVRASGAPGVTPSLSCGMRTMNASSRLDARIARPDEVLTGHVDVALRHLPVVVAAAARRVQVGHVRRDDERAHRSVEAEADDFVDARQVLARSTLLTHAICPDECDPGFAVAVRDVAEAAVPGGDSS